MKTSTITSQTGRSSGLHSPVSPPPAPTPARPDRPPTTVPTTATASSTTPASGTGSDSTAGQRGSTTEELPQLGALIRRHRTRIGLTQRELADLSTISVRAIRDLEQNRVRRPRSETVRLIADALRLGPRSRDALQQAARNGRFGPLAESGGAAVPPAPPTALHAVIGRDREIAVITEELASGSERLLHIVGLAGSGKTRLALEVAGLLHREERLPVLWFAFPSQSGGSDYVTSAETALAEVLHRCVAGLLGDTGPSPADPCGEDGPTLAEYLGDQPAVLVVDGAPGSPTRPERLARLLRDCPGLRLLVTSEEPWQLPGERVFLLTPLETADGEAEHECAAARVFLDDVRRVSPGAVAGADDLAAVTEICRRLDGLPTALLAASSWLVLYDLAALRRRLAEDPTPFLDHLAVQENAGRYLAALHSRVTRLPDDHRMLLAALCASEREEFSLDDVEALTGSPLGHCGRTMRDLLVSGVVRTVAGPAGTRFQVLHLVRAACRAFPTA
ncbi:MULTISPECIES: helix-turn-helix domain-containing protein [unclassified Streptomyces]|uniref:helix-turn-helix domain-containing protein n=1 Tax=unclassified Streptomyces TaxID=2593676 RepID=UPI0021563AAA|nr:MULTISPECIES: helix-turn-helix domain-containing protein [unclassified Streptomyces]